MAAVPEPGRVPSLQRVFVSDDLVLAEVEETPSLLAKYLACWQKAGVELYVFTNSDTAATTERLKTMELWTYFVDILVPSGDPVKCSSKGDFLLERLRTDGWVPREQLVVDSSEGVRSILENEDGGKRRFTLAHTVRYLPDAEHALGRPDLEAIDKLIFTEPERGTKHCSISKNGDEFVLDEHDNAVKCEMDGVPGIKRKSTLNSKTIAEQLEVSQGRPDLAELVDNYDTKLACKMNAAAKEKVAVKAAAPPKPQAAAPPKPPRVAPKAISTAPKPAKATTPTRPVYEVGAFGEGSFVEVASGPNAGRVGTVVKVTGEGDERRWRVQLDGGGPSTWATMVLKAQKPGAPSARKSEKPAPVAKPTSPDGANGGKGKGKGMPPVPKGGFSKPRPKEPAVPEFGEGAVIEVVGGPHNGCVGTVLKVIGEGGNDLRWRVQLEGGGPSTWVGSVKAATRAVVDTATAEAPKPVMPKVTDYYDVRKEKLGEGAYGTVCVSKHKVTGVAYAVKSMVKPTNRAIDQIRREVEIMEKMDHPNIIKLYETFEDHRKIYLVMELCEGGELFDHIIDLGHFSEKQAADVMQQVFRAVYYLHEHCICHRDLKPENFLFTKKGAIEGNTVKIIDFGIAKKFGPDDKLRTRGGSSYYIAPEICTGRGYEQSVDLWSSGVIIYVLLCGYPPFDGQDDQEILGKVQKGEYRFNPGDWAHVSEDGQAIVQELLRLNPQERLTAAQALHHTWVASKAPGAKSLDLSPNLVDNLRRFSVQDKFKQCALNVIARQLSSDKIKVMRDSFIAFDKDGDGSLTITELRDSILSTSEEVPADFEAILRSMDANQSGVIDYTEFLAAALDRKMYVQEDVCWVAFTSFDVDGDSKISKDELRKLLGQSEVIQVATRDIDQIMNEVDKNGDGEIDFDEFLAMMRDGF